MEGFIDGCCDGVLEGATSFASLPPQIQHASFTCLPRYIKLANGVQNSSAVVLEVNIMISI